MKFRPIHYYDLAVNVSTAGIVRDFLIFIFFTLIFVLVKYLLESFFRSASLMTSFYGRMEAGYHPRTKKTSNSFNIYNK